MTRFFIASMIAYLISQYFDVWFYNYIKNITLKNIYGLEIIYQLVISSLVDNTVFSIFAWILLNPEPISIYNVIMIYIFRNIFIKNYNSYIRYAIYLYCKVFY